MKAFIVSVCIVFLLTLLIVFNAIYVNKVTGELVSKVENTNADNYNELFSLWQKRKLILSLCASHKEIDKIEEQIVLLKNAFLFDDDIELSKAKRLAMNYIEQIRRHEELTIDNII